MDAYQLLGSVQGAARTVDYQKIVELVSQNKHIFSQSVNPVDTIDRTVSDAKEWKSKNPSLAIQSLQAGYAMATGMYQSSEIYDALAQLIRRKTQLPPDNPHRELIKQEGELLAKEQLDRSAALKTEKAIIDLYLIGKLHLAGMEEISLSIKNLM